MIVAAKAKATLLRKDRPKWPLADFLSEGANSLEKGLKEGNIFEVARELDDLEECFL